MATSAATLICFLLFLPSCYSGGRDNQGTEFILSFLDNQVTGTVTDLELFITTMSNNDANVNVTLPLNNPSFLETAVVQRTIITKVIIPHGIRGTGTQIEDKGIWIQSDEEIVVFGVNKETYSTDAYQALPVDVLSTEYFAITGESEAQLGIVATVDSTSVSIELPSTSTLSVSYNGVTYTNGDTISITLNRFETFHMEDLSTVSDFTGCRVTSTYPVGIVSGNYKVAVPVGSGSSDHMTEQVPPVDALGTEFYTYSTPDRLVGDYVKVLAVEDLTTVTVSDGTSYSLNQAEFVELDVATGTYVRIESNKGILVGLLAKTHQGSSIDGPNGGDPSLTYLLPRPQWAADYTYSTVRTPTNTVFVNYIVVHIDPNEKDGLRLDQNNVTGVTWETIPNVVDMEVGVISVSDGSHNIYHTNPAVTFSAISTGVATFNSYAFASGTRMALINAPCTANTSATVAGDIIDNDCDGMIDEETANGIDDDADGLVDEDLANLPRVEGNWGAWTSWTNCSEICEAIGNQTRSRQCDNPAPANGGQYCPNNGTEVIYCDMTAIDCYQDGNWTAWSSWDNCTGTCGTGTQFRERNCTNPIPKGGGNYCPGSANETISCTLALACASDDDILIIAVGSSVGGVAALAALAACCCLLYPIARKKIFGDDEEEEEEELPEDMEGNVGIGSSTASSGMPPVGTNRISPA